MTALERDHPEWAAFLRWHNERLGELKYPASVVAELRTGARNWVNKGIAFDRVYSEL